MHCSLLENLLQLNRESFLKPLWSLVSVRQCLGQAEHTLGWGFSPPSSRPGRGALPPGLPARGLAHHVPTLQASVPGVQASLLSLAFATPFPDKVRAFRCAFGFTCIHDNSHPPDCLLRCRGTPLIFLAGRWKRCVWAPGCHAEQDAIF